MATIRDTLTKLLASDKPEPGTPLAKALGQYPFQQGEAPLETPMLSPDDLIGTGIGKAALVGGAKLAPMLLGHTAFHGSPHLFEKFILDKLGTGEGAQAFGHGMYFAENPKVAEAYQKIVQGPESTAQQYLKMYKTPENAISALESGITPNLTVSAKKHSEDAINVLKSGKELTGNIYKVDIPDEHIPKMLDWDKPLKEQNFPLLDYVNHIPPSKLDTLGKVTSYAKNNNLTVNSFYDTLSKELGSAQKASEALQKAGVPGIKYLDEGSRELGQGTNNFVVFDPNEVKILNKSKKLSDLLQQ
jgi:hypothetical protein